MQTETTDKLVEAIQQSTATEIIKVGDISYTTRPVFDPRKPSPQAEPLTINTLSGIVDYLKVNVDVLDPAALMLHVSSHDKVSLIGDLTEHFRQRETFVLASCENLFRKEFQFGAYYDSENFIIALQSLFLPTPMRDAVLKIVGNIKDETVSNFSDDGVSQSVVAKSGIARVEQVEVPNPVALRPYRTFREVQQPESLFVLRMQKGNGSLPKCALFEADGGMWKLEAIESIKAYLSQNIGDKIAVIG